MQAGPMRYQVTIQAKGVTPNAYLQGQPNWTSLGLFPCSISQLSGRQAANADRLKVVATHMIVMRWPGFVIGAATHRLSYVDAVAGITRIFNVRIADNVLDRYREYHLTVDEVKNPAA